MEQIKYRRITFFVIPIKVVPHGGVIIEYTFQYVSQYSEVGRCKVILQKCGYLPEGQDTTCECGTAPQTTEHLLVCSQMGQHCTHEDGAEFNDYVRHCVSYWLGRI